MVKNNLLNFFRKRKKNQLKLVHSYSKGFTHSIRNYENSQLEEEINRLAVKFR